MSSKPRRWALLAATAVSAAILLVLLAQLTALRGQDTDLFPRWYGLRQLLLHGRNPYADDVSREIANQIWFFDGHVSAPGSGPATPLERIYGFLYPLPGMLLLAPLALLPYPYAFALWLLAILVMVPLAALWAMEAAALPPSGRRTKEVGRTGRLALAAPLALFFLPTWADIMLGQLAPAVLFLVTLAMRLSRRPFLAGASLAAAVCIKPHLLALLAPMWLSARLIRALRGDVGARSFLTGFVTACATLVGAALILLPSWPADFLHAARDYVGVGPGESAALVLTRMALPGVAARPLALLFSAGALLWLLPAWRRALQSGSAESFAIWRTIMISALVVPPAWETNAVLLLLPLAVAVAAPPSPRIATLSVLASAVVTLALLPPYFVLGWQRGTVVILAYVALLVVVRALSRGGSADAQPNRQSVPAAKELDLVAHFVR